MQLKWTKKALVQFAKLQDYIAQDSPLAAQAVAQRIADATHLLLTQPDLDRLGRIDGTREWVVKHTPYLLAYRHDGKQLQILRVIHSKQQWPENLH